jgi:hypothetical protein
MGVADKDYQAGQGQYGGQTDRYKFGSDGYNLFKIGKKTKSWRVNPEAFDYEMGVPKGWNEGAAKLSGISFGQDARAQQLQMMNLLAQRAQGENLASAAMAQQQLEQGTGAIASRMASSMRGGYDPAAARDAMYATGALGGQVAGSAATAAAQEQMAAAQAMGSMGQGVRQADIQQGLGMHGLAMQLRQMGLQDKQMDMAARMAYEQAMMQAYYNQKEGGAIGGFAGGLLGKGLGYMVGGPEGAEVGGELMTEFGNWAGDY